MAAQRGLGVWPEWVGWDSSNNTARPTSDWPPARMMFFRKLHRKLDSIYTELVLLRSGQNRIEQEIISMAMNQADLDAKLAALTARAQAESDFETAAAQSYADILQMLRDAKASAGPDTTAQIAAIDAAMATLDKGHGDLAAAVSTQP